MGCFSRVKDVCDQLLLTVKEAAARLRLGRSLTYRLIQTGQLPSVKVAGARRVLVRDLDRFVEGLRRSEGDEDES
jgi:excisionase family DNA binding protein